MEMLYLDKIKRSRIFTQLRGHDTYYLPGNRQHCGSDFRNFTHTRIERYRAGESGGGEGVGNGGEGMGGVREREKGFLVFTVKGNKSIFSEIQCLPSTIIVFVRP